MGFHDSSRCSMARSNWRFFSRCVSVRELPEFFLLLIALDRLSHYSSHPSHPREPCARRPAHNQISHRTLNLGRGSLFWLKNHVIHVESLLFSLEFPMNQCSSHWWIWTRRKIDFQEICRMPAQHNGNFLSRSIDLAQQQQQKSSLRAHQSVALCRKTVVSPARSLKANIF